MFSRILTIVCAIPAGIHGLSAVAIAQPVDFNRDIRPILAERCFQCHGPDAGRRKADLRLDTRAGLFAKRDDGSAIVPKHAEKSVLFRRISTQDADLRMPPPDSGKPLTAAQIAVVKRWIAQGAEWTGHWAYLKPAKPRVPKVPREAFVRTDVDRFILAQLKRRGMKPSQPAGRRTLIRRLKFDLLGLPPTPEEVDAFVADKRPDAFERVVDRYLTSPRFGERMAMSWLDQVRFADTNGYHGDNHRDIYAYRDYVVRSFNQNKPFDRFTVEQLAGDLLPQPTIEQKIASGYNRLLMTTREGGSQAREYRAKYAADRVRNVSAVWLGSTMGCAECHDHKFDPFTMQDFYSMAAFFADLKETAVGKQPPNLKVPAAGKQAIVQRLDKRIAALQAERAALLPKLAGSQRKWEAATLASLKRGQSGWQVVVPAKAVSSGRATLKPQKDGSTLSTGRNPAKDTYSVTLKLAQSNVTALRLEALTHPSLKTRGLSRGNGNFVLTGFAVSVNEPGKKPQPVKIARAVADFSQPGFPVQNSLDGKPNTGWAVLGHQRKGQSRTAVFVFARPISAANNATLTVQMRHQSRFTRHNIGRFRLSVTTSAKPSLKGGLPAVVIAALKTPTDKRSARQKAVLSRHYASVAPELQANRKQIAVLEKQKQNALKSTQTTLISEVMPSPRMVRILPRGNWLDDSGKVVQPSAPGFLNRVSLKTGRLNRLDLAKWVVSRDNPLTARVFVNRLWKLYYGRGIVTSLDDFGVQGTWPTHPELLDWLTVDFVENGWDVKRTIRLMVTSGAYQQSSRADATLRKLDPYNRWFARQSRFRLDAEMIRDNALAVSGLLVDRLGGRSVKPYQPAGYWSHLNFPRRVYKADAGDDQYRRGVYAYWCRTFLHPSLRAFDAPTREECTVERPRSNTPVQALVLLNDSTYVEAARTLAERVLKEAGRTTDTRIRYAYRLVLSRPPRADELKLLTTLVERHRKQYRNDAKAAAALIGVGLKPAAKNIPIAELAAWTSLTRVLLNLHETITRY